jgi:ribosomal protein S27AE
VKHYGKKTGIITRSCSKCGSDLKDRHRKQKYCLKCHAEYMRLNRPRHSQLTDEQRKKANARSYAHVYLKRGKIQKQNCVKCGSDNSQMHHEDYDKPIEVIWYCRICHLELHKNLIPS